MLESASASTAWQSDTVRSVVDPSRPITYGVVQPGTRLEHGIPLIRGQDYSRSVVDDSDLYLIHPNIAAAYKRSTVKGGDILFSIVGYLGQTAVVPDHLTGANITQTTARIAVKQPHHNRYFLQQFRSEKFAAEVRKYQKGSAQPGLNLADVERMAVVVPPPEDQSRIAAVLDTVDEAIAKTEAVVAKLGRLRTGLVHDLLTRGLDQLGQLRDPIAHPERFQHSPLGRMPLEWVFESLGERLQRIAGIIQTGPFGSQLHSHEYTTEGVPVIMPQDVLEGSVSIAQIARIRATRAGDLKRHRVKLGDLIFARRGDLSRCAAITAREVGWLCGTGCLLVRFGESTLSPHWLSLAYRHDIGQRQIAARAVGTTMVNLNTKLLAYLRFAFPPREEQEDIVKRVAEADTTILKESANLLKLGLVKSGLMADLLTGRVPVPAEKGN